MTMSASTTPECKATDTALVVIGSIPWFGYLISIFGLPGSSAAV